MYGSIGHASPSSPGSLTRSQVRGRVIPVSPWEIVTFRVERQFLQRRERWVAFDDKVDAPITIPGILTNLEIVLAYQLVVFF
jgi:hypothetical protein